MNNIWLMVFATMIGGSVLKHVIMNPIAAVVIDLAVLGISFLILRRYPYIDLKQSMSFLTSLTIINILVDLGVVDGFIGNIALLALIGWLFFKRGGGDRQRRPRHPWNK